MKHTSLRMRSAIAGAAMLTSLLTAAPASAVVAPDATVRAAAATSAGYSVGALDATRTRILVDLPPSLRGRSVTVSIGSSRSGSFKRITRRNLDSRGDAVVVTTRAVRVGQYLKVTRGGTVVLLARIARIQKAPGVVPEFGSATGTVDGFTVPVANHTADVSWRVSATNGGAATISSTGLITVTGLARDASSTVTVSTSSSRFLSGSSTFTFQSLGFRVSSEAMLRAALAAHESRISVVGSIYLANPLEIAGPVVIDAANRGDGIGGNTVTIKAGSGPVTLRHMSMWRTENHQVGEAYYGIWVDTNASLVADDISLSVWCGEEDVNDDGFTVQSGGSLTVRNSYITVEKCGAAGSYLVYGQNGATSVTLTDNVLDMPEYGSGSTAGFTHLIGTQGASRIGSISVSGNTGVMPEVTLLVSGSTIVATKAYAAGKVAVGAIVRALDDGRLFKRTTTGWDAVATNGSDFEAAVEAADASTIYLQPQLRDSSNSTIALSKPLALAGPLTIDGVMRETTISGNTVTIKSGTGVVSLKHLSLSGTENHQVGEAYYGVWVDTNASLVADDISLTVACGEEDVNDDGFTVQSGGSLTVRNSAINVDKCGASGSYAVYGQNGATSVTLTDNLLYMSESGDGYRAGFTHLIGTQGASRIGSVSVSGNNGWMPEVTLLVSGSTVAATKAYAAGKVPVGEIVRSLDDGRLFKRSATGWDAVATNGVDFEAAVAAADAGTIYLQPRLRDWTNTAIELTKPLLLAGPLTIDGMSRETTISGNTVTIRPGTGVVTLQHLTLQGTEYYQVGEAYYGVWVDTNAQLVADDIALSVTCGEDVNDDGFTVQSGASLTVKSSDLSIDKCGASGSYLVYGQDGAASVTLTDNWITMTETGEGTAAGFTHLIGTQGASRIAQITLSGNLYGAKPEIALMVYGSSVAASKTYALAQSAVATGEKLRTHVSDGVGWQYFTRTGATTWADFTP